MTTSSLAQNQDSKSFSETVLSLVSVCQPCSIIMSNEHLDKNFHFPVAKFDCEDDAILHDISNSHTSMKKDKFNQVIGSSPSLTSSDETKGIPIRRSYFAKPTPCLAPISPSRGSKWDMSVPSDDFVKFDGTAQNASPTIAHAGLGSPVRSDAGMSLETLITKQASSAPFSQMGSLSLSDTPYLPQGDLGRQSTRASKALSFSQQQQHSSSAQAEIEMLKRQLEAATRKIDQIQNQFGHQTTGGDSLEYGQPSNYADSSALWNEQVLPSLEQLEQRDSFPDNYATGTHMARSYSPGTYPNTTSIWNNQTDNSKGKSRFDRWYSSGNQSIGNTGLYSFKQSIPDDTLTEPESWAAQDLATPGIYESNFRSGGFTPKPKNPETESQDNVFSQDVRGYPGDAYPC